MKVNALGYSQVAMEMAVLAMYTSETLLGMKIRSLRWTFNFSSRSWNWLINYNKMTQNQSVIMPENT